MSKDQQSSLKLPFSLMEVKESEVFITHIVTGDGVFFFVLFCLVLFYFIFCTGIQY